MSSRFLGKTRSIFSERWGGYADDMNIVATFGIRETDTIGYLP
jgi:hypothetical protein